MPESWRETLPDDLRDDPILARFNDVPAMAKALVSAQKMVGADKVAIPSAGDAEAWGKVYDRLGRPESGDGYELAPPAGFSHGRRHDFRLSARPPTNWACHRTRRRACSTGSWARKVRAMAAFRNR